MSEATQTPSMEDTIAATLRDIQGRVDAQLDDEATQSAATAETQAAAEGGEAEETISGTQAEESGEQREVTEQVDRRKAPSAWRKQAAEKFAALDPLLQDEIDRREADFHKGIEGYKSKAQLADEFSQVVAPYMATIQSFGVTPVAAAQQLFASDHILRYGSAQQKQQMLQKIATDYGVDLASAVNYEQPYIDPQLQSVQQQLAQMQNALSQQDAARQQAEQQALNSEIHAFAADPAHKHFEAVKGHMSALLLNGAAQSLKDAYEQAIWANPEIRQALLAEQQQAQSAERARQAKAAKAAAATNVRKTGTLPAQTGGNPAASIEDTLRAQLATMRSEGRF